MSHEMTATDFDWLDWTAFVWELVTEADPDEKPVPADYEFVQFILVPGAAMLRTIWDDNIDNLSYSEESVWDESGDKLEIREACQGATQDYLEQGFAWSQRPYLCDFTNPEIQGWFKEQYCEATGDHPFQTLHAVLTEGTREMHRELFFHINACRPDH